jgi:replicative superfamily II helicase
VFNEIQSESFNTALYSKNNTLICADWGTGKTAVAELAVIGAAMTAQGFNWVRILYISPFISQCQERVQKWQAVFKQFSNPCDARYSRETEANMLSLSTVDI